MFGILLAVIAAFFIEIGCSIAKYEHTKHSENIWAAIFLNGFFTLLFYIGVGLYRGTLDFVITSWPLLILGVLLGLCATFVGNMVTLNTPRSLAGSFRMLTVPLLTIIDYYLGYDISPVQVLGIGIVVMTILTLMKRDAWHKPSTKWLLLNTLTTVIYISVYKYNIDHTASIETVQVIGTGAVIFSSLIIAQFFKKQNLFKLFTKPFALLQASSMGLGSVLDGFAYSYAPASIITATYRSSQALWTLISGSLYFHEHKIWTRIIAVLFLTGGVVLLTR